MRSAATRGSTSSSAPLRPAERDAAAAAASTGSRRPGRCRIELAEHTGDSHQLLGLSTTREHGLQSFIGRRRIPPEH
jgi:hypothetical protein